MAGTTKKLTVVRIKSQRRIIVNSNFVVNFSSALLTPLTHTASPRSNFGQKSLILRSFIQKLPIFVPLLKKLFWRMPLTL
jgi:hypothetical protein